MAGSRPPVRDGSEPIGLPQQIVAVERLLRRLARSVAGAQQRPCHRCDRVGVGPHRVRSHHSRLMGAPRHRSQGHGRDGGEDPAPSLRLVGQPEPGADPPVRLGGAVCAMQAVRRLADGGAQFVNGHPPGAAQALAGVLLPQGDPGGPERPVTLDQRRLVSETGGDLLPLTRVGDSAVAQAARQGRRMEARPDDGPGVPVGADAVDDHVEHVATVEVRRGPHVRLHPHRRTVAAGVGPSPERVGVPQRLRLPEIRRCRLGGAATAERV